MKIDYDYNLTFLIRFYVWNKHGGMYSYFPAKLNQLSLELNYLWLITVFLC